MNNQATESMHVIVQAGIFQNDNVNTALEKFCWQPG